MRDIHGVMSVREIFVFKIGAKIYPPTFFVQCGPFLCCPLRRQQTFSFCREVLVPADCMSGSVGYECIPRKIFLCILCSPKDDFVDPMCIPRTMVPATARKAPKV